MSCLVLRKPSMFQEERLGKADNFTCTLPSHRWNKEIRDDSENRRERS